MSSHDAHEITARIADICQALAGRALDWSEPPGADRFEELFGAIEPPAMEAARRTIDSTLCAFTRTLADKIHANFHQRFARSVVCDFRAQPFAMQRDGRDRTILVHESLETWAHTLREDFRAAHDSAAQRARRALETSPAAASIDDVARRLGVGKRTLERHFRVEIGVSVAEYRTRLRLAAMVTELGMGQGCVESAMLTAGWASRKGGYDRLRDRTGLTPTAIRALSQAELDRVIASLMICGRAGRRSTH